MLLTHLRHSVNADRPVFYGFDGDWREIDTPVLGEHSFLEGEREIAPFALAKQVPCEWRERFPGLSFERGGHGRGRQWVIRGPIDDLRSLAKAYGGVEYPPRPSGTAWMRRHAGLPFSVVEDGRIARSLSLDEFLSLPVRSFDSEFAGWESSIALPGLRSTDEQVRSFLRRHGVCDAGSQENLHRRLERFLSENLESVMPEQPISIQVAEPGLNGPKVHYFEHLAGVDGSFGMDGMDVVNYRSSDAPSMLSRSLDMMHDSPFAVLVTQNGMSYDLLKLREYGDSVDVPFEVGGASPLIKSSAAFFKRVVLGPVMHFDFAPYAQNHLPFTMDNKFETLMSLILGRRIVKKQDYGDLTRLWVEMLLGRSESSRDLKEYGIDDVVFLLEAWQKVAPVAFHKARAFGCGLEDLCVTSTRTLALNRFKSQVIPRVGYFPWSRDDEQSGYKKFDSSLAFSEKVSVPRSRTRPGIFDGSMFYVAPWLPVYGSRLRSESEVSDLLDHALGQDDIWRIDILDCVQDGLLLPTLFEHEGRSRFDRTGVEDERLAAVVDRYQRLVASFPPRNVDGFFHVWSERQVADPLFSELSDGLAWHLCSGNVFNVRGGAFALHDGVTRYVRGFDSKMTHGFMSVYEQDLGVQVIDRALLGSSEEALDVLFEGVDRLRRGDVPVEDLLYVRKAAARHFLEFSAPAQRQARVRAYIQAHIDAGQPFARAPVGGEWLSLHELDDVDRVFSALNRRYWVDHMLGPERPSGRDFRRGSVGRFAPALLATKSDPGSVLMDGLNQYHLPL